MITKPQVREIASFESEQVPVTSFYLDVDARERTPGTCIVHALGLLRELRSVSLNMSETRRAAIDEDREIIRSYVARDLARSVDRSNDRGIAIFSCRRQGFWRVVTFPAHVEDSIHAGCSPNLLPLIDVLNKTAPVGIVLADREKARFFVAEMDRISESDALIDDVPGHIAPDAIHFRRHEAKADAYKEHRIEQHLRNVVAEMERFAESRGIAYFLVGGPREVLPEMESLMPKPLASRVRAYLPGMGLLESENEVLKGAETQIEAIRERDENAFLTNAFRGDGSCDRTITDIEQILDSVSRLAVDTLLIERGLHLSGAACRRCGRLSTEIEQCPQCGGTDRVLLNDILPQLVTQALRQDADVRLVAPGSAWGSECHMGAILRFGLPGERLAKTIA